MRGGSILPRADLWRDQRGQALVEFAVSVPILAVALFALVEFGLMLNDQVAVVNASRDGARVAVLLSGDANQTLYVQQAVCQAELPIISHATGSAPNCTADPPGPTPGCSLPTISSTTSSLGGSQIASWSVYVACTYTPFTPLSTLLGLFSGGSSGSSPCSGGGYNICSTTTMRDTSCNQPSCSP